MYIQQYDVDRVLDANPIEDVIGEVLTLKREGSKYKCCCPFHNEDTPSFVVTPAMNIYKCFGCGESGNAISFLRKHKGLTYVEAVQELAKRANIRLHTEENTQTAEEQLELQKKDAARHIAEAAAKWFVEQLHEDSEPARFALNYVIDRWGKNFIEIAGIGFAPGQKKFYSWAQKNGFSKDILTELGFIKEKDGKIYDGFYNRIIMPIRSRSNNVVGFTARVLDNSKPKYINSPESILFKKSEVIFGLNVATREATKQGMFYLVEGAPDVYRLQSIGATNAVASLGTAWSKDQFSTLLKYNASICFIPDADPSQGKDFGPGIKSVLKNGKTAIEAGLRVLVKEIVPESADEKADADSFIKNITILEEMPNEDFIIWYAKKRLAGKTSSSEKAEVMRETSELLSQIKDKDYEKMLVKRLSPILGITQPMLRNSINERVRENIEKKHTGKMLMDREKYMKYGFFEEKNCYFSLNKDSNESRWSNFKLEPLFHIKDQLNPKRLFQITNVAGQKEIIELKQQDLISIQAFKLRIEGLGNYIWEAKDEQLTKLKGYLYENTETAVEITQLGWQKDGFFAFGNGIVMDGQWLPVDNFGIVKIEGVGNFYLPAASKIYKNERKLFMFERKFIHAELSELSFRRYTEKMIEVFGDKAKVGICFLLATLFKDVVTAKTKNFPILNLFGPKGSGKSELGHTLMSFFIINNEPPNLSSATDAALADAVAQCANAIVHIDEYKNTIELSRREFIKGLYDGVGRTRMNMDRDKKREITAVDCGVIISGQEMPTIDIAIFSRLIYLSFDKTEYSIDEKRRFDELKTMRDMGCSHMTIELLRYRKRVEAEFSANYNTAIEDILAALGQASVEDRIFRNWVVILAIFRTLSGVIDVSFDYKEMLKICVNGILNQNGVCKSNNELAAFWQTVDYLHQNGEIFNEADYRIKYETSFKGKGINEKMVFLKPKPILYLCTKRVMMLYRQNAKKVGEAAVNPESLRHYLETSKEFLGTKNAVRFKNLSNTIEASTSVTTPTGVPIVKQTSRTDWALCFDYAMIADNYQINLEVQTDSEDDVDLTDIDENDKTLPY